MKIRALINVGLLSSTVVLGSASLPAQSWQTVDDYLYRGTNSATPLAATADGMGGIYVAGWGAEIEGPSGTLHALVRYSKDSGQTWQTVDDFVYPGGLKNMAVAVHADLRGNLFSAVTTYTSGPRRWVIRRSTDRGLTWQTVDDFAPPDYISDLPSSLTSDTNGNFYALGAVTYAGGFSWVLRRSSDQGTNWSTASVNPGRANGLICVGSDLFVAGSDGILPYATWQVFRSRDAGATWSVIDQLAGPYGAAAWALAVGRDETLYTAGGVNDGDYHWMVRQGQLDGTGWISSDEVPNYRTYGAIAVDPDGKIYVIGNHTDQNTGLSDWLVRCRSEVTGQWSTSDNFLYDTSSSGGCSGAAVVSDALGNVFSIGNGMRVNPHHWLVRKLAAPIPPAIQLRSSAGSLSLSWPTSADGFRLEVSDTLGATSVWSPCPVIPVVDGAQNVVTIGATNAATFFRLRK